MKRQKKQSDKWYKSARWQRMRKAQLAKHPYCQCPHHTKDRVLADVVDHKEPHREDPRKFWNPSNLQSMLKACHDKYKHSQEMGGLGFLKGSDARGWPLSHEHEWHANGS